MHVGFLSNIHVNGESVNECNLYSRQPCAEEGTKLSPFFVPISPCVFVTIMSQKREHIESLSPRKEARYCERNGGDRLGWMRNLDMPRIRRKETDF